MRFIGNVIDKLQRHPKRIVFPEGAEPRVLQAARQFHSLRLGAPILLGNRTQVKEVAQALNVSLEGIRIINPAESSDLQNFAHRFEVLRRAKGMKEFEAREAMLARAPVPPENVHPVPTDGAPDDAARRYERTLQQAYGATTLDPQRPLFDITLLGLGPDGHTASLLPGEPVLNERKRWVAAVSHGRPEVRITMTYPVIESSRKVAFLLAGKEKAAMFKTIRAGSSDVPAARVKPVGELIWFVDRAAAGEV